MNKDDISIYKYAKIAVKKYHFGRDITWKSSNPMAIMRNGASIVSSAKNKSQVTTYALSIVL
ncbi:hypothetical protein KDA_69200 [Dictyobacter alpinus]|uniref:Uncharacterized protein n=1 Tax=Dictyobacter alpinus TaxID=2014873 RepID=A0A402BJB8_9CHLR|nr:hypothetical protein KDA_69200 [Dictyobacter alpinus]